MICSMLAKNFQVVIERENDEPDIELLFDNDGSYIEVGISKEMALTLYLSLGNALGSLRVVTRQRYGCKECTNLDEKDNPENTICETGKLGDECPNFKHRGSLERR